MKKHNFPTIEVVILIIVLTIFGIIWYQTNNKPIKEPECALDSDCQTPFEFLIQSNCPFGSACISGECKVVCPFTSLKSNPAIDKDYPAKCKKNSDCNCNNRGTRTLDCICHNGNCLSVESDILDNVKIEKPPKKEEIQIKIPIENAMERITKKPFGIYITPQNSPINPEKFTGYHTGADFEIFNGEEDAEVNISAICKGELIEKKYVNGYGGVAIQKCLIDEGSVTVLYGHLKLDSIVAEVNQIIGKGEKIGILGKGYSNETDGERKHLHLGVHRGDEINYLGYVNNEKLLDEWIDPDLLIRN